MKRSPELTPLSHDHHQALFAAQQLKRAEDPAPAIDVLLGFWRAHGRDHFRIEEEILLPGWIEGDPTADREMAARISEEHLAIRARVRRAERDELSVNELHELGALLADHVRFEERELFPLIEAALEPGAIAELGVEIADAEARVHGDIGG
jgi:Hemerythrin HHE cation binding domain